MPPRERVKPTLTIARGPSRFVAKNRMHPGCNCVTRVTFPGRGRAIDPRGNIVGSSKRALSVARDFRETRGGGNYESRIVITSRRDVTLERPISGLPGFHRLIFSSYFVAETRAAFVRVSRNTPPPARASSLSRNNVNCYLRYFESIRQHFSDRRLEVDDVNESNNNNGYDRKRFH